MHVNRRTARRCVLAVVLLGPLPASALTTPISGAVALPSGTVLKLPFPSGARIRVLSGYGPGGGSSLHADTNATNKTNDHYALDLVYEDEPNAGKGRPVIAPLGGTVVKAGWATSGWANYGQRVILRHDLGDGHVYHSVYAHLDSVAVTENATVAPGQALGTLGQSCQGALSCLSFSTPHLHWVIHRDSSVGGSGTGGSYGGNAVVQEALDGHENTARNDIITSTNGAVPMCGDNFCDSSEQGGACPQDCPVCEAIPATGRTLDEPDPCFQEGGDAQYWRVVTTAGHGGALRWTHTTNATHADNTGTWTLNMAQAGRYVVEVFTDPAYAQSRQARYVVRHAGTQDQVVLDQSAGTGFRVLGTFTFTAGGDQWVRLDDNTGEAFSLMRQLVFDAVRITPEDMEPADGGTPAADAGSQGTPDAAVAMVDAGQPRADAGPAGTTDAGSTLTGDAGNTMMADAGAARDAGPGTGGGTDGSVPGSGSGDPGKDAPAGSCAHGAVPSTGLDAAGACAALALLVAARRKRAR